MHFGHDWLLQGFFDSASASRREPDVLLRMTTDKGGLTLRAAALLVFVP